MGCVLLNSPVLPRQLTTLSDVGHAVYSSFAKIHCFALVTANPMR